MHVEGQGSDQIDRQSQTDILMQENMIPPMRGKSKSGLGLDLDLSPIFNENGLDLDLT